MTSLLVENETCWRIAEADRVSMVVDAAGFFEHARNAMLKAERSIYMIGWDFDTRINLVPGSANDGAPENLAAFSTGLRNGATNSTSASSSGTSAFSIPSPAARRLSTSSAGCSPRRSISSWTAHTRPFPRII